MLPVSTATDLSSEKESNYMLVIKDTVIKTGNMNLHTYSVNGMVPPKILELKSDEVFSISFRNETQQELMLILPQSFLKAKTKNKWIQIQPGLYYTSALQKQKSGTYSYRITRLEDRGNGIKGLINVKY